jgi:hypothetical protein
MEELLSQLPEDVIGSELNRDHPGRAPFPSAFHLQGGHVTRRQKRGAREEKVCVVSEAVKVCLYSELLSQDTV